MTPRTWHGIGIGTLNVAVGLWFSMLVLSTNTITALAIAAVAIVMSAYAMAGFSRADDPGGTGFKAALFGLITGVGMFSLFLATDNDLFVVAAPIAAVGATGIYSLAPIGPRVRQLARATSLVVGSGIVWLVFTVDPTVYFLIVPLIPLPAIGFADRVFDRAVGVIAEDPLREIDDAGS